MPAPTLQSGLSLIECLIALAVLAILTAAAGPSMRELKVRNQLDSMQHAVLHAAQAARSFAISRNQRVSICASPDGIVCSGAGNWSKGWLLYADRNANQQLDASDERLHVQQTDSLIQVTTTRPNLIYRADGSASGSNLTIRLCLPGRVPGNAVVIANSGRIRAEKISCS